MARKIIILDQVGDPSDYRVVFWLDVPAARQRFYVNATAKSAFLDATAPELTAIQTGVVTEIVERFNRPNGTTLTTLRTALAARHVELQTKVADYNPWNRYGSSFDGSTWTAVTVG